MLRLNMQIRLARLAAVIAFLVVVSSAGAATMSEYRERLAQAAKVLPELKPAELEYADQAAREGFVANHIARVRELLPATETVLFNEQSIEVDNRWLHAALSEYEKSSDGKRQAEILQRSAERLDALLKKIDEMKGPPDAAQKDQDKARLSEILRRPEYNKEAAQGSAIERLWERFLRWLESLFPKAKPMQPGTGRALSSVAQVVVIVLSLALVAFLVWKFLPRFLSNRGKKKPKREARIVLGERLEADQTAADLLEQAEALARAGDLRGAIRKAYIALLCELGDRKVISLAQHKTNRDYLMSVRNRSALYQTMRNLTNRFELHWYGFVPPAASDWAEFRVGVRSASATERPGRSV